MQYCGGKVLLAKALCPVIRALQPKVYIEPFCGGCAIIEHIKAPKRIASDASEVVITLFKALQDGFEMPENVSEGEYKAALKKMRAREALSAFDCFALVACSFAGQIGAGYARNSLGTRYAAGGKRALEASKPNLEDVEFYLRSYKYYTNKNTRDAIVYCDPPYKGTVGYKSVKERFCHDEFFEWARELSKENIVLISEFQAPQDFLSVWEKERWMSRHGGNKATKRLEKIFLHESSLEKYEKAKASIDDLFEAAFLNGEKLQMVI